MLVPLQTLPGWPEAPVPSLLEVLGLLVGAPLLVVLIVAVLTRVHHATKGNMGTPGVANQPIWVNGRRIEPSTQGQDSRDSIDAGHRAVTERAERDEDDASTGGAGARW
jgi:hypothetical protein